MAEKCMDESKESPKDEAKHSKGFISKVVDMKGMNKTKSAKKMKAKGMKR